MKIIRIVVICCGVFFGLGCGGSIPRGVSNPAVWVRTCRQECRYSPREVTVLERDGSESRLKIAIITISPPYVCRCE